MDTALCSVITGIYIGSDFYALVRHFVHTVFQVLTQDKGCLSTTPIKVNVTSLLW